MNLPFLVLLLALQAGEGVFLRARDVPNTTAVAGNKAPMAAANVAGAVALHDQAANYGRTCRQQQCVRKGCEKDPSAPECCSQHMFKALVEVTSWLDAHNYKYVLTGGTLLGAVRNETIIPWTSDVDIIVVDAMARSALQQQHTMPGKIPFQFFMDNILRGCSDDPTGEARQYSCSDNSSPAGDKGTVLWFMDLYDPTFLLYQMNRGHVCLDASENKMVTINGKQFRGPNDPHGCCQRMYGPNYMTPIPSHHNDRMAFWQSPSQI
eukprot:TRINITY_DN114946_c0_g1_i1.p1 TRINITY_DN114946_c0_g1~~TRINITY_DN114946_c0_g1_i1.p1  ORF type:complete len:265 (-),score=33.71 TRINITY_DN114946_c0_g1_i1:72-866(-)